jgi:hypothetical protein
MGGRARVYVGTALAVAAWAAALACVPHPSPDPVCDGTSSVKGEDNAIFVAPAGEELVPFPSLTTNALLPLPGGRGYVICPGTDDGNGQLNVPKVPDGLRYLFQSGNVYIETTQRDVDFSEFFVGRSNAVIAKSTTPTTLNLSNMESWDPANDSIGLFSWGARTSHLGVEQLGSPPSTGATSATLSFDWSQLRVQALPDASKNDEVIVTQYSSRAINIGTAGVAVKRFVLAPTIKNGQPATLTANLIDINLSRNMSFTWSLSQFDNLALDTAPDFDSSSQNVFIHSVPGGQAHGFYDVAMNLFKTGFSFSIATDKMLSASIAQPLPGFTHIIDANEDLSVTRTFHGAAESVFAFIYVEDLLDNVDRGTLKPGVGPAKALKLNGQDWSNPLSAMGTTPVLSWQPAASAQAYRILVNKMKTNTDGTIGHDTVATMFTDQSSLQIPDGVVASGDTIYCFVDALNSAGYQFDKAPFKFGEPTSVVRVVSQTFTP